MSWSTAKRGRRKLMIAGKAFYYYILSKQEGNKLYVLIFPISESDVLI